MTNRKRIVIKGIRTFRISRQNTYRENYNKYNTYNNIHENIPLPIYS